MADPDSAGLDDVATQLYALPRGQFTAARNDRAKAAAAAGDKDLAAEIRRLAKPSAAAEAVNRLMRAEPGEIAALIELGESLREAQAALSGDALRQLSAQRHRVIAALVDRARVLAREAGEPLSEATAAEVHETLTAAMSDRAAGDAVRRAQLTTALAYAGLGDLELGPVAAPPLRAVLGVPGRGGDEGADEAKQRALDAARREMADAERAAGAAADELARADTAARDTAAQAAEAHEHTERLRAELRTAQQAESSAVDAQKSAVQQRDAAARAMHTAEQALARARAKVSSVEK